MGSCLPSWHTWWAASNATGVKMSAYLPQVLPEAIRQFLFGQVPIQAAGFYLIFMTVMGTLGGALARGIGRGSWRQAASARWTAYRSGFAQRPLIQKIRTNRSSRFALYALVLS